MTPKDQAEVLADKCTDAIIEAPEEKHTQDIIRDTCCLVEFFEVVKWATATDSIQARLDLEVTPTQARIHLGKALAALRAKLPKGIE